jgi:hypothetical protein
LNSIFLIRNGWRSNRAELGEADGALPVFDSRYKCPTARNLMIALVAGGRYVPNREFLAIPSRSELIHCGAA